MADMNIPTVDNSSRIRPATGLGGKGSPVRGGGLMSQIPEAVSSAVTPLIQQAGQQINSGVNNALGTDGGKSYSAMTRVPLPMYSRITSQGPIDAARANFMPDQQAAFAKGGVTQAQNVQAQGRGNDTMLVHMTPREVGGLQALAMANGGSLTINPQTGLPEAGFLDSLLPTILGIAGTALFPAAAPWMIGAGVGGIEALRTGDIGKGLMAGLGAFGGANLGSALSSAGTANALQAANTNALGQAGTNLVEAGVPAITSPEMASNIVATANANPAAAAEIYKSFGMNAVPSGFSSMGAGLSGLGSEAGRSAMGSALSNQFGAMSTGEKIASGLGAMNTLGGFEQPQMATVEPYEYNYEGPYKPTKRTVTYPGADRTSTSEFSYFSPSNPIPYARGGGVNMEDGGFVMDARSVSEIGNGSSNAGLERLASLGARPIQGRGDGVSDSIPANIGGSQDARVARDEAYFPPEAVMKAGGATKLYAMMDKAHKARKNAKRGQDTGGLRALMA